MASKMKRGQVTIFVILAIVIVVVIALFLLFSRDKTPETGGQPEVSAESFLDVCLKEELQKTVELISERGGKVNPEFYIDFKYTEDDLPTRIRYLCYTSDDHAPCVNQDPMIFDSIEQEIKSELEEVVESCFFDLQTSLSKEGYAVEGRYAQGDFDLNISEDFVSLKINAELTLTKGEERTVRKDFEVETRSKLFDILMFPVEEIIRRKAASTSCNFDSAGYELFYPRFEIDVANAGDGVEIYSITQKESNEEFRFAVRSCATPGGYGVR